MSSADRGLVDGLTTEPPLHSLSNHFPTFIFLWRCLISFGNGVWRRHRGIASVLLVIALSLVVVYGCWESAVGPQRRAVAAIQKAGGSVAYDWEWKNGRPAAPGAEPPWPRWLVKALGQDTFGHVTFVRLTGKRIDDALMTQIGGLSHLEHLYLHGSTLKQTDLTALENLTALEVLTLPERAITDEDLAHLAGLTRLTQIQIPHGEHITNKGLAHLARMRQIKSLSLINTKISSLEPIRELTKLKQVNLQGAPITDDGLAPLEGFTSLQWLSLGGSRITDAGIAHFAKLSNLTALDLNSTNVGDAGAGLLFELPELAGLSLFGTRVTDAGLAALADRINRGPLQSLVVSGPGVTPGATVKLQKKLPRVNVSYKGSPPLRNFRPRPRVVPAASAADEELPR